MKIKELLKEAKKEIKDEKTEIAIGMIKTSLKAIAEAERILKALKEKHKKLLNIDVSDIETEEYVY